MLKNLLLCFLFCFIATIETCKDNSQVTNVETTTTTQPTTPTTVLSTTSSTTAPTTTTRPLCDEGWTLFERTISPSRCIRAFNLTSDRDVAQTNCEAEGATLTGVESLEEANRVADLAYAAIGRSGSIWLGLYVTPSCVEQKVSATCTEQNAFMWTDESTVGVGGFNWSPNQPSGNGNCSMMVVTAPGVPSIIEGGTWPRATFDDTSCIQAKQSKDVTERKERGYACGKATNV